MSPSAFEGQLAVAVHSCHLPAPWPSQDHITPSLITLPGMARYVDAVIVRRLEEPGLM